MGSFPLTTLGLLYDDVYGMVYGVDPTERPKSTLTSGSTAAGATSVSFDNDGPWEIGDYVEFADDGELAFIEAGTSSPFTIRRGERGTTDATQADNSVVYRNPQYARYEIERAVNQVVRNDLWPHVWSWSQGTLSFTTGDTTYDLANYEEEVVMMYQFNLNSDSHLYPLPATWWDTELQIASAVSANDNLLRLRRVWDESATVFYTAKRRPDPSDLSNMSDEVAELVPWAAAAKLLAGRSAATRQRPDRSRTDRVEGGTTRDYRTYMGEFLRMRKALRLKLDNEVEPLRRFRPRRRKRAF